MRNAGIANKNPYSAQDYQNPNTKVVFVRVLKSLGNNRYEVSFLGERTELYSKKTLEVGATFKARGFAKNGKPFLEIIEEKNAIIESFGDKDILAKLGIPTDRLSELLLSFFKSLGIKINTSDLQKARALAELFDQNKEEVAEIALFLLNKGIEPSKELLASLLSQFLLEIKDTEEKESFFKATNHIKTSADHWLIFPLESFQDKNTESRENTGLIKLLINTDLHITKKLSLFYLKNRQKVFIVLDYDYENGENKAKTVDFCLEPPIDSLKEKIFSSKIEALLASYASVHVRYNKNLPRERFFILDSIQKNVEGWA